MTSPYIPLASLRQCRARGMTLRQACREVGISYSTMLYRMAARGILYSHLPPEEAPQEPDAPPKSWAWRVADMSVEDVERFLPEFAGWRRSVGA